MRNTNYKRFRFIGVSAFIVFLITAALFMLYYLILHPQGLTEAKSIPTLYPHMKWKLVSEGMLDYSSDFGQGILSRYSKTFYASDPDPTSKNELLSYYREELKKQGWYEMPKNYYDSNSVIGYFSKLPYKNVHSKFAYIPYERRFFRIKTMHNEATNNYEFIIEYNTQLEEVDFK